MLADTPLALFDLNGTLVDPGAIGTPWQRPDLGEEALSLAVKTAMVDALVGEWRDFAEHLRSALESRLRARGLRDGATLEEAMQIASGLPAFDDVEPGLTSLSDAGVRLAVLTNSGRESGRRTLEAAGLAGRFDDVLGVDAVHTFKPHPRAYDHALAELNMTPAEVLFVSAHGWDLAGATHAGMGTALLQRGDPPASVLPRGDVQVASLPDLADRIAASKPSRGQSVAMPSNSGGAA